MKKKWFRALSLADEKYIAEADSMRKATFGRKRMALSVLAGAACLALMLCNLWLFMPFDNTPPSAEKYKGNDYFPVIKQLAQLTWEKPVYKNNFEKLSAELQKSGQKFEDVLMNGVAGDAMEAPGEAMRPETGIVEDADPDGSAGSTYEEVTDNQVEGITEADRIKRSSTHIYYLDGTTLKIFSIAGLDSRELGRIELVDETFKVYLQEWEFYLSEDCKTVTVIALYPNAKKELTVAVISLDVSDPAKPTEKNRVELTGNYLSSRMTDGKLLLLTEFVFTKDSMDFDKESTYLPQINGESIPVDDIIVPEDANSTRYTVVMKLDESTLAVEGKAAFLSYSEDVYVSKDHIFLTHVYADVQKKDQTSVRNAMTEITCLTYADAFKKKGSAVVRGYVKDQWSMDEYEGILRVVTTTNATTVREIYGSGSVSADVLVTATGNSNASLYCIDLQNFKVVASVEDFAPPREEVQSVRFDKTVCYVCTSIEMSDPVFFFDLSDLENITYKDTGTIEGFSTSLVNMGNGYLLGIGQGNWGVFKAEIYQETKDGVEGFCEYTLENAGYSLDYKSYYIDRENQLIGLGITQWDKVAGETDRYIVLFFDGYHLVEVLNVELYGDNALKRGVYIDGYMYLFSTNNFKVEKIF